MEVGVPAAPVGDLGERVSDEDVLQREAPRCHTLIGRALPIVVVTFAAFECEIRSVSQNSALAQPPNLGL